MYNPSLEVENPYKPTFEQLILDRTKLKEHHINTELLERYQNNHNK